MFCFKQTDVDFLYSEQCFIRKYLLSLCLQKDIDGGVDYCRRKVMLVKDKVEQLAQIIQTRQQALTQIQTIAAERSAAAS